MSARFMPSQLSVRGYGVASSSRPRNQSEGSGTGGARSGGKAGGKSGGKADAAAQDAEVKGSLAAAARRAAQQRAAEARAAAVRAQMQQNKATADAAKAAADAAKAAEDAAKAAEAAARAAEQRAADERRKEAEKAERDRRAAEEQRRKDAEKAAEQARKDAEKAEKDAAQGRKDDKPAGVSDDARKRADKAVATLAKVLPNGRWEGASASKPKRRYRVMVGRGTALIRVWEDAKAVAEVASDRDPVAFLQYAEDVYYSIRKAEKPGKKDVTATGGGTGSGAGGGAGSGAGSDTGTGSGAGGGSTATASWAGAPYLMEIAALVGWTGPSSTTYGVNYAVRQVTLDGIAAPAIDVVSASGTKTVTPNMPEWFTTATEVITAKAAGVAAAAPGTPGTTTVTQQQISGQDYLPGEGMEYPSEPSGGRDESDRLPSSGEMIEAPEGQGVMAFVTRNKWWLLGGAAAYVLAHRSNPAQFPLPDAISKLVK